MSTQNTFTSEVKTWLRETPIHGIPKAYKSKSAFLKTFWFLGYMACLGYLLYSIINGILDYLDYTVAIQVSVLRATYINFPTVTICNMYPYKIDSNAAVSDIIQAGYANQTLISELLASETIVDNATNLYDIERRLEYVTRYNLHQRNFTSADRHKFFYNLSEMLVQCVYNNQPCDPHGDFEQYSDSYRYGYCYKFNSGRDMSNRATSIKTTSSPGRFTGLRLEIFLGHANNSFGFGKSLGVYLFVHNASSNPAIGAEGVSLDVGQETSVIIDQNVYKKQTFPYSDCVMVSATSDNSRQYSESYQQTVKKMRFYDQKNCLIFCFNIFLYTMCGCWDVTQHKLDIFTAEPCNASQLTCILNAYDEFYGHGGKNTECFNDCPPECDSVKFELTAGQSAYPAPVYANLMIEQYMIAVANESSDQQNSSLLIRNYTTLENIKKSTTAINVYYEDIRYTLIAEQPSQTPEEMVAYLGGFLGLCMGASFLSFAELIELAFNIAVIWCKKCNVVKPRTIFADSPFKKFSKCNRKKCDWPCLARNSNLELTPVKVKPVRVEQKL